MSDQYPGYVLEIERTFDAPLPYHGKSAGMTLHRVA
jgi:hypothetical protein